jgi:hypothetical protein
MATQVPPKKNIAYTFYVGLVSQANTKLFQVAPTLATGDVKSSLDGGAFGNLATLPVVTPAAGRAVRVDLSAGEMNGDNIVLQFVDAAGAEWCDLILNLQTAARQIDDLAFPATSGRSMVVDANGLVDANTVKVGPTAGGTAQTAGDIMADTNDIQTRLPAALVGGRMDASVGAMAANVLTATAIAADAITAAKVADGMIDAATFAAGAINAAAIATDAITAAKIAADAIGASELAADAVTEIQSGLATSAALATVQADTDDIQSRLPAALTANGNIKSSLVEILTTALTETAGLLAGAFKKFFNISAPAATMDHGILVDTVTTYTGNTPQTGDVFPLASTEIADIKAKTDNLPSDPADESLIIAATDAIMTRLGVPSASVSADVAAVKAETSSIQADTNDLQTRLPAALVGGRMDSSAGAMAAGVVTATAIATDAIDADALAADAVAEIADSVWDELIAGHLGAGSTGKKLDDASTGGDPWATPIPGAYGAGTAGKIVGDNLDAKVSTRALEAGGNVANLQTRVPAALTGAGYMKADALAIDGSTTPATNLKASASVIYVGSVTGAATATTLIDAGLTQADVDHWKERIVIFLTGALKYQATDVTGFDSATDKLTFTLLTQAPAGADQYVIV